MSLMRHSSLLALPAASAVLLLTATAVPADAGVAPSHAAPGKSATPAHCAGQSRVDVPAAEVQKKACLDDLTTAGTRLTGHTNVNDWSGLHASRTRNPSSRWFRVSAAT